MSTLLLLAMMQVPDTLTVRVPMPTQTQRADTTIVRVDVRHEAVPVEILEGAQRSEAALVAAIEACGCGGSAGPPHWFYAGVLTLGAGFLYRYWTKDSVAPEGADIDVDVDVEHGHPHGRGKHGKP